MQLSIFISKLCFRYHANYETKRLDTKCIMVTIHIWASQHVFLDGFHMQNGNFEGWTHTNQTEYIAAAIWSALMALAAKCCFRFSALDWSKTWLPTDFRFAFLMFWINLGRVHPLPNLWKHARLFMGTSSSIITATFGRIPHCRALWKLHGTSYPWRPDHNISSPNENHLVLRHSLLEEHHLTLSVSCSTKQLLSTKTNKINSKICTTFINIH